MGMCIHLLWYSRRLRSEHCPKATKRYLAHNRCLKCSLTEKKLMNNSLLNWLCVEDALSQIIVIIKVDIVPCAIIFFL